MKRFAPLAAAAAALAAPSLAAAEGGVSFIITGDTLARPFAFTNTSTAGEKIVRFDFDLSTIQTSNASSRYVFDTAGSSGFTPFTPREGTDVLTGLVASPAVPDGAQAFYLSFSDFVAGEIFKFGIDVDTASSNIAVFGQQLIGATVKFTFDDGKRIEGQLRAVPGVSNASTFVTERVVSAVPEPGTWALLIGGFGLVGFSLRRRAPALAAA